MEISKSLEEYIKTMYVLQKQNGIIRVTDIAQKMKCSPVWQLNFSNY